MQGGVAVAAPTPEPPKNQGIALEVAASQGLWREIAKVATPIPVPDVEPEPVRPSIDDPAEVDPRDVIMRPTNILRWALDHLSWKAEHRNILEVIWFEGSIQAACRILRVDVGLARNLYRRAKSELIMSAKRRDWAEEFERTRLNPVRVKQFM